MNARYSAPQAKAMLAVEAMKCVATNDEFRQHFTNALKMTLEFGKTKPETPRRKQADTELRRWLAFCAVAPALYARGDDAWKTFCVSHLTKLDSDTEIELIIHLWVTAFNPTAMLERMMADAEAGRIDEGELVRLCDIVKTIHSVQEEGDAIASMSRPAVDAWLATR